MMRNYTQKLVRTYVNFMIGKVVCLNVLFNYCPVGMSKINAYQGIKQISNILYSSFIIMVVVS